MTKKLPKETILKDYVTLSRKLGKFPSVREVRKFVCSGDKLYGHYDSLNELKAYALEMYPELAEMEMPAKLNLGDIEAHRLGLEKKLVKAGNNKLVSDVSTLEYVQKFAENVFAGRIKGGKSKSKKKMPRTHTLVLSDLHIGADISKEETGVADFGKLEESRRLAAVVREAGNYKPQYRKETKLVLVLAGDIIENCMHDARTGAPIAEQTCRAIHLLSQAVGYLANLYPQVDVYCATGNHDRNVARHHSRAVHGKGDSWATVIYFAVKAALSKVANVTVTIPMTPLSSYEVYGKRIGYTHGDTVIKTGGIYSTVKVDSISNAINKINAALPDKDEFAALIYGHTHIAHVIQLPNGTTLIGNGALPPPDPFAISIGSLESNNSQTMFESVPGYPVGDLRLIKTGRDYDKDEALDEIIQPWKNY